MRAGLVRVPAVYIIRLNRVTYDHYGRESRVSTSIDYPVCVCARAPARVCVPHFPLSQSCSHTKLTSPHGEQDTLILSDSQLWWPDTALDYHGRLCGVRYKLYAVVFHRGATVRTGHYFASVHSTAGTQRHTHRSSQSDRSREKRGGLWCCCSSAMSEGTFSRKPCVQF